MVMWWTTRSELQIGRRLYLQGLRDSESRGCDVGSSSSFHEMDSSSEDEDQGTHQCGSGSSKDKIPLPEGVVEYLINGQLNFPFSKEFSLPSVVPCLGDCGEAYYCRCNKEKTVCSHLRSFARYDVQVVSESLPILQYAYPLAIIHVFLVYDHHQREEKKREVMDNEVMLQRKQMKYKHETEFLEDSLALSRLAPYSSKFVSSEEEFFESDMMTSHPHSSVLFSFLVLVHRWPRMGGHRFIGMRIQHQKLTRKCEVTTILVLYSLPRLLIDAILAHKLLTAYSLQLELNDSVYNELDYNPTGSVCDSEEAAVEESNGNKDAMDLEIRSRGNVVGKLVRTKHHKEITFPLVINSFELKPIRFKKNSCTYV
ncbi:hypothetical protein Ahy_A08g037704 [Arachis hypogaea]|uniref:Protein DA1-like domain-containing protein n=1 Tax=Arachis hypogaea TaxID=3818 RepID=A0A445BRN1_ARAHY|nr:hypothetical protein Ahy_A08g037704 [Arachis hypogaea]